MAQNRGYRIGLGNSPFLRMPVTLYATHKAVPGAFNWLNFQKTIIRSYLGSKIEEETKKILALAQNFFSFRVVLRLRGKIVPPPIMAQPKIFFCKIWIFWYN